jgi:hypothetical protein
MLSEQNRAPKSAVRKPILYSSFALMAVFLYVVWIFFSRWQENRKIEQRAEEQRSEKQLASDRQAIEQLGGKELKIENFYASATAIHRGESLQLCYNVANAKIVKLEPQDSPVWPSHYRCVDVSPKKDARYTLTIQDAAGHTQEQSIDIKVH